MTAVRRDTWRSGWGTWRPATTRAPDRFTRDDNGRWRYGTRDPAITGLLVPGARDYWLSELARPVPADGLYRPPEQRTGRGDDGWPSWVRADRGYLPAGQVALTPELRDLADRTDLHDWVTRREWAEIDPTAWAKAAVRPIGLRAPELASTGFSRSLALAERDVRLRLRRRAQAAARRLDELAAARAAGIPTHRVTGLLGITRARLHQLLADVPPMPTRRSPPDLRALRAAHEQLQRAHADLVAAQAVRRARVRSAAQTGMGLGQIADTLDVSRGRAQQLRDGGAQSPGSITGSGLGRPGARAP